MGNVRLEVGKKSLAAYNSRLQVIENKADNFDTFTLVSKDATITFTLPQTLTPSSVNWAGMIFLKNVQGTFDGGAYTFSTVQLGPLGYNWATNYTATGSETKFVEIVTPGLFSWNSEGTVTLNTGVFHLGDFTLTVVDPPGDAVGVPEPASLILLGFGGLALGALR